MFSKVHDGIQKELEPTNNYNSHSPKLIQDLAFRTLDNFLFASYALQSPLCF